MPPGLRALRGSGLAGRRDAGAELLELCNKDPHGRVVLNMARDFPRLKAMAPSPLLIPLQESLIANIPTAEVDEAAYKPFPVNAPRIISACAA